MKPSILDKLQNLAHRLEEVTALLGSPEATADMDNYRRLNQEHAELTPIVETYRAYTQAESDLVEAQEMLSDPDMKDFAAFNEVYAKHFPGKPARSCFAVKDLPAGALCEIEVIAVK